MNEENTTTENTPTVEVTDANPDPRQVAHNNAVKHCTEVQFELVKRVMEFLKTLCNEDVRLIHNVLTEAKLYAKVNHETWFHNLTAQLQAEQAATQETAMTPVVNSGSTVNVPVENSVADTPIGDVADAEIGKE